MLRRALKMVDKGATTNNGGDDLTLAEALPEYGAAFQRLQDLIAEHRRLVTERNALQAKLYRGEVQPSSDRERRVAALAGLAPPAERGGDRDKLLELEERLSDIEGAQEALRIRLMELRLEASHVICDRVADQHREMVRSMAATLAQFHAQWTAYEGLLNRLRGADVAIGRLRVNPPLFAGAVPANPQDGLARWFKDVLADGHLDRAELPEAYR